MDQVLNKINEIEAKREAIDAAHKASSDAIRAELDALKASGKETSTELASLITRHTALQERYNEVLSALQNAERSRAHGGAGNESRELRSAGRIITRSSKFDLYKKRGGSGAPFSVQIRGNLLGGLEERASDTIDFANTGRPVNPEEDPEIVRPPRKMPKHRELATVMEMFGVNNRIRVSKRTRPLVVVTKVTATALAAQADIEVNRLAGISVETGFNACTILGSAGTENKLVDSVTPDDAEDPGGPGTITLTTNLANQVEIGDLIEFEKFRATPEAELRPKGRFVYTPVDVATHEWTAWVEATDQQLRYDSELEMLINDDLVEYLGINEGEQFWNGTGADNHFDGVLNDADVLSVTWSAQDPGTTRLDCVALAFGSCEAANYMPTDFVTNATDKQKLKIQKGTDGQYVMLIELLLNGQTPRIFGLNVHVDNCIPADYGVVGDFARGVKIYDTLEAEIEVGYVGNQFAQGMKTIRGTMNSGMYIREPQAMCKIYWDSEPT